MNSSAFLRRLKSHSSPRKPWLWLVLLFAVYSLGLGLVAPRILERQLRALVQERLHSELVVEKTLYAGITGAQRQIAGP
jgi:hypothetical protein